MVLAQPGIQTVLQDRGITSRSMALAMDDTDAANMPVAALGNEITDGITCHSRGHAMHIEFVPDG